MSRQVHMEPITTANARVPTPTSTNTMVEVASDDDEHDNGLLVFTTQLHRGSPVGVGCIRWDLAFDDVFVEKTSGLALLPLHLWLREFLFLFPRSCLFLHHRMLFVALFCCCSRSNCWLLFLSRRCKRLNWLLEGSCWKMIKPGRGYGRGKREGVVKLLFRGSLLFRGRFIY